jgi:hypothetical protein
MYQGQHEWRHTATVALRTSTTRKQQQKQHEMASHGYSCTTYLQEVLVVRHDEDAAVKLVNGHD